MNDGLKTASFRFMESALSDLTFKEALEEVLSRNIENCAQSFSLTDVFAHRNVTVPQFVCAVANFIRGKVEEPSEKVEGTKEKPRSRIPSLQHLHRH